LKDKKILGRNITLTILVAAASYLLSIALESYYTSTENILLIFVISLLFIVIITKSYFTGIFVSIVEMAVFNIYFVAPRGSILTRNFLSFALFIIAAIIIAKVVTNLQKRTEKEIADSIVSRNLYRISRGLINISGVDNIIKYSEKQISDIMGKNVTVFWGEEKCSTNEAAKFCFENKVVCGWGHQDFTFADSQYFPVPDDQNVRGVVCIPGSMDEFSTETKAYTRTFFSLVTMAIQRENLRQAEEEARVDAEREKFKSDLLHSISHDLRTPLTVISGGAEFLSENLEDVDKDTVKTMLEDIASDSEWLSSMVENLLNMTRIQEGKLVMNMKKELVEDIVSGAAERVKKSIKNHTLRIENSEEMLFVKVDGQLITKVIINLLDNAFRHTRENSNVVCRTYRSGENVVIEVMDDGGGIAPENLSRIFESFFTTGGKYDSLNKGAGIGLSICKSIVEAHGGEIEAENNHIGGATFRVKLREERENE